MFLFSLVKNKYDFFKDILTFPKLVFLNTGLKICFKQFNVFSLLGAYSFPPTVLIILPKMLIVNKLDFSKIFCKFLKSTLIAPLLSINILF